MNYPPLNEKLLDCVMKHIEENPEAYDQNIWIDLGITQGRFSDCGTTACIAGWACLLTVPNDTPYMEFVCNHYCNNAGVDDPLHVKQIAREKLGLTHDEAHFLFASVNRELPKARVLEIVKDRVATIKHARGLK